MKKYTEAVAPPWKVFCISPKVVPCSLAGAFSIINQIVMVWRGDGVLPG